MAITINGSTGITSSEIADGTITSTKIADGTIVNADVNDVAASKLTGALPAISGASLTNLPSSPSLGEEQTWTSVSRSINTTYTNSTGSTIAIYIEHNGSFVIDINGLGWEYAYGGVTLIIPNGNTWKSNAISTCFELS